MAIIKTPLMRNWIYYNFLGWFFGVIAGPFFIIHVVPSFVYISRMDEEFLYEPLSILFFTFPFGFTLGIMQKKYLQQQGILTPGWKRITTLGIGIPATIMFFITFFFASSFLWSLVLFLASTAIVGISTGGLQTISLNKSFPKSISWASAYVKGFLLLGIACLVYVLIGTSIDYFIRSSLREILNIQGYSYILEALFFLYNGIIFSILATICIGIPTGKILKQWKNEI
jgi:hypothetical protein